MFDSREQAMHDLLMKVPWWEREKGVSPPVDEYFALLRNLAFALEDRQVENMLVCSRDPWGVCEMTFLTEATWVFVDFNAGSDLFELSAVARSSIVKVSPGGGYFTPEEGANSDTVRSLTLKFQGGKFVRHWITVNLEEPYGDIDELTVTAMRDLARGRGSLGMN